MVPTVDPTDGQWVTWGNDPCTALVLSRLAAEAKVYETFAKSDAQRALDAFVAGDDTIAQQSRRTAQEMRLMGGQLRQWIAFINARVEVANKLVAEAAQG